VRNLIIFKVAAQLNYFKPLHISDRLARSRDRVIHGVFNAVRRGTDKLNLFIDVIAHNGIKPWDPASRERNSERRGSVFGPCPGLYKTRSIVASNWSGIKGFLRTLSNPALTTP
jgi:hypothetical protein